ncbi:outer membrane transport energization protein ExbD [Rhodoblastus acidophilus]|uniref:Outer membrane transport energization protein ExbD n=1 Tax=Rhodoblastus acidophilus TaxID=1074 RepID=A0A212PZ75_RHOAC|nr:biopolymer transporter ExbD [Rhodoblastus acidophilus]MCW2318003.1 biopolymer transport protein ExbD [Rhodoblastus acidophilus]PPQ38690.1 biopolymer transporter ExbD [Rhodoblastus acidophilus]RAI21144.1 biopolymer transporter ExbD [Rhodoblastus acidophilus]SNB52320.1 outer membrane transport energization protein ExbD [Rhodoblastus acidophilus]
MRSWPRKTEKRARIEIIPMIDVMMFLLVFFVLISMNVLPALGLRIAPPTSARPDQMVERTRMQVGIDPNGGVFLDGVAIELAALTERLKAANSPDKPLAVIIAGDSGANLQHLVSVLDALKAAGVASAQIVAKQKP